jgi:hypothetical protein
MRRLFACHSRLVLLLALLAGNTTPARAQLGKLKKMGADAVKDAAAGKKPEAAKDPTAARIDYAITEERITSIITVLTPLAAVAQREANARAVSAAYDKEFKAASDCLSKIGTGASPDMSAFQSPKYVALMTRSQGMAERVGAAQAAKRYREYLALSDTFVNLQLQTSALMFKNSCPPVPYKPMAMIDADVARMERMNSSNAESSDELTVPPTARSGMTTGQFGRIRERMAVWALIQAGELPATSDKFTDEEKSVLAAHAADIKKFGPLFKSGTMRWATWADIKSW